MIDREVFSKGWRSLCRRWQRKLDADEATEWFEYLSPQLSTEQFQVGVRACWASSEFFPKPDDIVTAALGTAADRSLEDWDLCRLVMGGSSKALARMTEAGRKTVALMGGADALRQSSVDEVHFRRQEFLRLHESAQEICRRETRPALGPGSPEADCVLKAALPKLLGVGL